MSERKNIDRIFQEKFKDFEAAPPEHVWRNIEAKLKEEKEDRKVLPLWFRLSGIAAALFMGFLITDNIVDDNRPSSDANPIVLEQMPSQGNDTMSNSGDAVVINGDATAGTENETSPSGNVDSGANDKGQSQGTNPNQRIVTAPANNRDKASVSTNETLSNNSIAVAPEGKGKKATFQNRRPSNTATYENTVNKGKNAVASSVSKGNSDYANGNATSGQERLKTNTPIRNNGSVAASNQSSGSEGKSAVDNKSLNNKSVVNTQQSQQLAGTMLNGQEVNSDAEKLNTTIANVTADDTITDTAAIATVVPNALEELLNEKENNVTTNEPKLNRWQVSSNVAPIYFSSTSNGSPIDPAFANNSKDYKQNLAYGLGVRYALDKKLTVRAGLNTLTFEYSTNDIMFSQSSNARPLRNVATNLPGGLIQVESKNSAAAVEVVDNNLIQKLDGQLSQTTGYIELPVELAYKVVDKKFGLEIIGGFSTLFLNENQISVVSSGSEMEIGKANNLNNTHFSTNVGVGLKYNFFKSFQVNVEPMFKYQINTFTDSSNFKPYFFGLYTGINYRF